VKRIGVDVGGTFTDLILVDAETGTSMCAYEDRVVPDDDGRRLEDDGDEDEERSARLPPSSATATKGLTLWPRIARIGTCPGSP
jgi:N-methylhydantoinase A/oxoprolinase/acetone carboxylase beta subunit